MVYGAVLAGGTGSRMGNTEKPKQFMMIGNKPIIVLTVETFVACDEVEKVIVLTPTQWLDYTRDILAEHLPDMTRVVMAAGGATRNETLMNAIAYIESQGDLSDDTIIVTHDAVRPFVTDRMIRDNIEAAGRVGACGTAFPATDTILHSEDGIVISEIPDRSHLYLAQTPQSFKAEKLRKLYQSLSAEEKAILTDATKIFVIKGEPVEMIKGESYNIKITYPYDIKIAEAILKETKAPISKNRRASN